MSSRTNSQPRKSEQEASHAGRQMEEKEENESTEVKIAILASLHPNVEHDVLLDVLIAENGFVDAATKCLSEKGFSSPRKRSAASIGHQTSLSIFRRASSTEEPEFKRKNLTRKGQTLHLYAPNDIANHTPCSIIHNFLSAEEADRLLRELLEEAPTFERSTFKLFDNVVQSPHSACFYVQSLEEEKQQKTEFLYNGSFLSVSFDPHSFASSLMFPPGCSSDYFTDASCLFKSRENCQ